MDFVLIDLAMMFLISVSVVLYVLIQAAKNPVPVDPIGSRVLAKKTFERRLITDALETVNSKRGVVDEAEKIIHNGRKTGFPASH